MVLPSSLVYHGQWDIDQCRAYVMKGLFDDKGELTRSVNGGAPPALPGRHPEFDSSGNR